MVLNLSIPQLKLPAINLTIITMTSYIITYRQTTPDRYDNLRTVLQWLNNIKILDLELVIVEQDDKPRLVLNEKYNFYIKHVFAKNSNLFNRAWGFNVGVKITTSEVLLFADSDLFVAPEYLLKTIELIKSEQFDTVSPFTDCYDLDREETQSIDLNNFDYQRNGQIRNCVVFSGGIVGFSRNGLKIVNGWDERFEGWGGEDDIQSFKIKELLRYRSLTGKCFHLYHERSKNNGSDQHDNYENNFRLFKYYLDKPSQIITDMNICVDIGNINKYNEESKNGQSLAGISKTQGI